MTLFGRTPDAFAHGGVAPGGAGRPTALAAVAASTAASVLRQAFTLWGPHRRLLDRVRLNAAGRVAHYDPTRAIQFGDKHKPRLLGLMNQPTTVMRHAATARADRLRLMRVIATMVAFANSLPILFRFLRQLEARDRALTAYERSLENLAAEKGSEVQRIKDRYEALLKQDTPRVSGPERLRRRAAVHHAPGRFRDQGLTVGTVTMALAHVEDEYKPCSPVPFADPVRDVTKYADVPDLREARHAEVLKQFGRPLQRDDTDPLQAVGAYRERRGEGAARPGTMSLTASFAFALGQVLGRFEALDRGKAISLRMFLATRLHGLSLGGIAAHELRAYLVETSRPAISAPVALHAGQTLLRMVWE